MRTLQESRDINAIKVLYYPMSVSLLQLWAQFGIWTLCITKIMERIYGLLSYIACENIKAKVPTRFTNLHELDIAHYLFFFSIRVFHTSHLDVVYRWTNTHLSLHNHTDCQQTDGNTIVEDHFFLTGHVTVKTQIKNGGTLGFLFVKAVWSLWELNQLQPAKEKKITCHIRLLFHSIILMKGTTGKSPTKQNSFQNLTF